MKNILFVTGKLGAEALETTLERMAPDFKYDTAVLGCSVAALMTVDWIAERLPDTSNHSHVMIPGLCVGDLSVLAAKTPAEVVKGPADLKDLPVFFGGKRDLDGYGSHGTKIVAEIVDAYSITWEAVRERAEYYRSRGADIIDLGCPPDGVFTNVGEVVAGLKKLGFTVSLDTFNAETAFAADRAGLDMLLSVNSQNLDLARKIRSKVVVVPDFGKGLESLERNAAKLTKWGVPFIMDPVLDPVCFGFTEALGRFAEIRKRYPEAEILMGAGNVTELMDADSAGINAVLAGVAAELGIDYILTTEVAAWTRGAVRELDLARKLTHFAMDRKILPKNIDHRLVALKDPPFEPYTPGELKKIQKGIKDKNFRVFTAEGEIHVFNREQYVSGTDPGRIFSRLSVTDPGHGFYLGRELEKAALAIRLGKKFTQDKGLNWGYLG